MSVKVTGVRDFEMAMQAIKLSGDKAINEALRRTAQELVDMAKSMCPVDTGYLRDSIDWNQVGNEILIDVQASYAAYVEFGTYKAPAQPFFFPSVDYYRDKIAEIISRELGDEL